MPEARQQRRARGRTQRDCVRGGGQPRQEQSRVTRVCNCADLVAKFYPWPCSVTISKSRRNVFISPGFTVVLSPVPVNDM